MPPLLSKIFSGEEAAGSTGQQLGGEADLTIDAAIGAGVEYDDGTGETHSFGLQQDVSVQASTVVLLDGGNGGEI
ncbi:hypothetical protein ACFOMD_03725 [Sphingoaurantiacus capsulatus]|uniref:Uncharacterized protein n=1 Tax=Sphingoaurantiacus capsulatus TaxID=1771310 RepID=A0ABV7X6A1_9SPHN